MYFESAMLLIAIAAGFGLSLVLSVMDILLSNLDPCQKICSYSFVGVIALGLLFYHAFKYIRMAREAKKEEKINQ